MCKNEVRDFVVAVTDQISQKTRTRLKKHGAVVVEVPAVHDNSGVERWRLWWDPWTLVLDCVVPNISFVHAMTQDPERSLMPAFIFSNQMKKTLLHCITNLKLVSSVLNKTY